MPYVAKTGVIGVAIMPRITSDRRSLEEILYDVTQLALRDAGLDIDDIDGIVVASNDQYDGRAISVMAASGSVGGVDRDILSTPSAGEHAFVMGTLRIGSGQYRTQLVVSWSPTEASSLPEAQRLAADPYFHRRLPLDELSAHALQASAMLAAIPDLEGMVQKVAEKNHGNGATAYPDMMASQAPGKKPRFPLQDGMYAEPITGAVAMVLASEAFVTERGIQDVAWVSGMGWATEATFLGDRDLSEAPALEAAAEQAYRDAGITDPIHAFEVAEVADTTPFQELLAYAGLGLAPRETWSAHIADGTFTTTGKLPVNLSGGALSLNPVYCTGLIRIAEIANQVLGRAGRHQRPKVRTGLAHAASGPAMQYNTVVVLRRSEQGGSSMSGRVGIIGIGQSAFRPRRDDASYPDLVREAVTIALNDAKLDLDDIEAVVYSLSPDAMVGIGNAERLGVDAVGARNKRFLRINTGGATGISSVAAAYYHVAAGACDVVLTAGADKVGECGDSQTVLNKIWDPTYERQLPLGTISMLAMSAVRYMDKYGMTEEDMARVVVKNRWQASKNPNAHLRKETTIEEVFKSRYISWPVKLFDCCPQSSGGGAMVLASEKYIKERNLEAVWITGVGHCSETYYIGDRMGNGYTADHADAYALRNSFNRAFKMAGITDPRRQVDVAEIYAPFSNTEFHSIEAAGLAELGQSPAMLREGQFQLGGGIPVNPSGGVLCTNAIAVTAMIRVAEVALQVWGRAGGHQVEGAKVGIASGNGGDHQFFGTMVIEA